MEPLVETLIESPEWAECDLSGLAERAARATLAALGLDPSGFAISLLGCDDSRIAELNAEFRGKPVPTNVLSWPSEDRAAAAAGQEPDLPDADLADPVELGDVAIAHGVCAREAAAAGRRFDDHVAHLLVHGVLHLLGYDHVEDADATLMEGREVAILATMGVPDPYADGAASPD
ncbi:MAG: rRNA maturation RNase YbeY [Rhodobacteraceae bacterium]|nr:rRNA maturation RNase YbeY [Paracoccaceae bacterium]